MVKLVVLLCCLCVLIIAVSVLFLVDGLDKNDSHLACYWYSVDTSQDYFQFSILLSGSFKAKTWRPAFLGYLWHFYFHFIIIVCTRGNLL